MVSDNSPNVKFFATLTCITRVCEKNCAKTTIFFCSPARCFEIFAQTKEDFSKINFKPSIVYTIYTHNNFLLPERNSEIFLIHNNNHGNDIGSDTYGVIQRYIFFLHFARQNKPLVILLMLRLRSFPESLLYDAFNIAKVGGSGGEKSVETETRMDLQGTMDAKCSQDSNLNVIFPSSL